MFFGREISDDEEVTIAILAALQCLALERGLAVRQTSPRDASLAVKRVLKEGRMKPPSRQRQAIDMSVLALLAEGRYIEAVYHRFAGAGKPPTAFTPAELHAARSVCARMVQEFLSARGR